MRTPVLETERLILRPLAVSDAQHIFDSWTSCPVVTQYMIFDQHENVQETIDWLTFEQANYDNDHVYTFGLVLKETGELIGSGGLSWEDDCFYIGYILSQNNWYKGFAKEAASRMIEFAKNDLGASKIIGRHANGNAGSEKILHNLGFEFYKDITFSSFGNKKTFDGKLQVLNF
ncbi:GNAT family N-acetyltransferase [Parendozoicomonas haliclonae]|uniref:Anhydro-N-acetylmuramic acid kinase n=1 Tax=Parendozoicomonas haliclonae TaxID=1960125 RepID=A0A1X7AGF8_9GAMM|nr:GNAT family N-acetyltransferase [Parendozoicomonas haliclonae]SMA32926.1 anhydro-N-acetylmuramic acid kinase [Parendozoicomonas haliclonae]